MANAQAPLEFVAAVPREQPRPSWLNMLALGGFGVGKSYFACSFPKPIALLSASSDEQQTVQNGWHDPQTGLSIPFFNVRNWPQTEQALQRIEGWAYSGQWPPEVGGPRQSIILDVVTFFAMYLENWADEIIKLRAAQSAGKGNIDRRQVFGEVKTAFQQWIQRFKALPMHKIITGHTKPRLVQAPDGKWSRDGVELDFPGYFGDNLPGMMFATVLMDTVIGGDGATVYRMYTRPRPGAPIRVRLKPEQAALLPEYIDNPTFYSVSSWLTYCGEPIIGAPNLGG